MSKTCAECKNHTCKNICIHTRKGCDGYCKLNERRKNCFGGRCKSFILDEYFKKNNDALTLERPKVS